MAKHKIEIVLNDEEEAFVKRLVEYDRETLKLNGIDRKVTFGSELRNMFYVELRQMQEVMSREDGFYE